MHLKAAVLGVDLDLDLGQPGLAFLRGCRNVEIFDNLDVLAQLGPWGAVSMPEADRRCRVRLDAPSFERHRFFSSGVVAGVIISHRRLPPNQLESIYRD